MNINNKYQHIIWDFNGTILNDVWLCVEVMNEMLAKRSIPILSEQRYKEIFDFPVKDYYQRAGFNFSKDPFEIVGIEFINNYDARHLECALQEGVENVMQLFSNQGRSQSVLSARRQDELVLGIKYLGIDKYFTDFVGLSDQYAQGKIENGIKHLKNLELNPHSVLLIGDTIHDYDVAKAIGCECVLISLGHQLKYKLETCKVPVFNNYAEMMHCLIAS